MEEKQSLTEVAQTLRDNAGKASTDEEIMGVFLSDRKEMSLVEARVFRSEKIEIQRWKKEEKAWHIRSAILSYEVPVLISEVKDIVGALVEDERFMEAPEEVRERLRNRKKGLDITCRMLDRLLLRVAAVHGLPTTDHESIKSLELNVKTDPDRLKPFLGSEKILTELNVVLDEIQQDETRLRDDNYEIIRAARLSADKHRREVTGCLKDDLLPIVDGLERGKWDEPQLKEPLKPYEGERDLVDRWFGAYHDCFRKMKKLAKKVDLYQVQAKSGMEFNPEWHTALGTEESLDLANEQILEVLRSGWRIKEAVIRPAEVVVVKNSEGARNERSSDEQPSG